MTQKAELRKAFGTWAQVREVIFYNNRINEQNPGAGYDYYEVEPVIRRESWMKPSHAIGKCQVPFSYRINRDNLYKITLYRDERK